VTTVAIIGSGPIGSATAARLAARGRVSDIRLVDASVDAAAGKALDIRQSGAVTSVDTRLSAEADVLAAAGATVIVLADAIDAGEWQGAAGRAIVDELVRAGASAPIVFAGPHQTDVMEWTYRSLGIPAHRLVGSAAAGLASAVRALAGIEMNASAADLAVVGRPPAFVIGWSAAASAGALVTDRVPAHRLLAISQSLGKLWPPGPEAIGAATARLVEALIDGSRRLQPALTIVDGELGVKGAAVMLPLELGRLRVLGRVLPSLSPQERTELMNGLEPRPARDHFSAR
jgi:malate dehydrogenase